MKKIILGLSLCSAVAGFSGCAQTKNEDPVSVDDAVAVSALEQGQDGSDQDAADATADGPVLDNDCHMGSIRSHIVASYDANHDGSLDDSEKAALRADFGGPNKHLLGEHLLRMHRIRFLRKLYDSDNSGHLDASERAELEKNLQTRCENRMHQLLQKFDKNADGKLDASEWLTVREDLAARFEQKRKALLAEFDEDHDGRLSLEERYAARLAIRERMDQRWDKLRADYDTNHDGKLDKDEKQAFEDYLKSRVRGEQFATT